MRGVQETIRIPLFLRQEIPMRWGLSPFLIEKFLKRKTKLKDIDWTEIGVNI
jgi:hypothetical protein